MAEVERGGESQGVLDRRRGRRDIMHEPIPIKHQPPPPMVLSLVLRMSSLRLTLGIRQGHEPEVAHHVARREVVPQSGGNELFFARRDRDLV